MWEQSNDDNHTPFETNLHLCQERHANCRRICSFRHERTASAVSSHLPSHRAQIRPHTSPLHGILATLFLAALITLCVSSNSSRDPGPWFFNSKFAYAPRYSAIRLQQAERFIEASIQTPPDPRNDNSTPQICVGIPSIARNGTRYLRATMGSLLSGLSEKERDGIRLVVFIPHADPTIHPAYRESWLSNLADEVLLYNVTQKELEHVQSSERDDWEYRTKGLYDYTYLLKACHAAEIPYIAMIEDDVVAMDGWYHRTLHGIKEAEAKSRSTGFLYLRMFYTEEFLGWNSEYWPIYTFWSVLAAACSAYLTYWSRLGFATMKVALTPRLSLAMSLGWCHGPSSLSSPLAESRSSLCPTESTR